MTFFYYLLNVFFVFIQVLPILTKNLHSPGTMSFGVPWNQHAKICPKVIRCRIINFSYCSLQEIEQIFAG